MLPGSQIRFRKQVIEGAIVYGTFLSDSYHLGNIQRESNGWVGIKNYTNKFFNGDSVFGRTRAEVAEELYKIALEKNLNLKINQNREKHSLTVQHAIEVSLKQNARSIFLIAFMDKNGVLDGISYAHNPHALRSAIYGAEDGTVVIHVNGSVLSHYGDAKEWLKNYETKPIQKNEPKYDDKEYLPGDYGLNHAIEIDRENQDKIAVNTYDDRDPQSRNQKVSIDFVSNEPWAENNAGTDRGIGAYIRRAIGFCCSIQLKKGEVELMDIEQEIKKLEQEIEELESIVNDPFRSSSNIARDLVNKYKKLKELKDRRNSEFD